MLRFFMRWKMAVIILVLLFLSSSAYADIYRYIDENGVICYTDAPLGKKTERVAREKKAVAPVRNQVGVRPGRKKTRAVSADSLDYSVYVHKAASKYEIEPELIRAVIKTESNGNNRAISRKGAMGLMQLMPTTASDMNVSNPFDPEENIEGGTRYLRFLLEKFNGDTTLALAAYNAGPKTVEKYGNIPPISETIAYVKKVFSFYKGKRSYSVGTAEAQDRDERPAPVTVYKIVLADGTVLFTNSPLVKTGQARF